MPWAVPCPEAVLTPGSPGAGVCPPRYARFRDVVGSTPLHWIKVNKSSHMTFYFPNAPKSLAYVILQCMTCEKKLP